MNEKTIIVKQGSVGSFLRGIAVGVALAMLFAPRSGRETRGMISEKGNEIKDKAFDAAKNTRERAQTIVTDARDKFGATVKSAADNVRQTADNVRQTGDMSKSQLKRELAISEDIENPEFPL